MSDASPPGAGKAGAMTPLQRAFLALESARARIAELEAVRADPIAVIGLGCRTPGGGDDPDSLWQLLRDGVDATSPLPADRWDVDGFYNEDPEIPGHIASRRGGFLSQIDGFDPLFFGITRREAQGMDPQQRLLLEVCWEALEHAGQPPDRLSRSATGVYVGLAASDYAYMQLQTLDRELLDSHFASGIAHSVASGRISYLLGLQGPSLTIDTACSSSLVAVHLACQALRAGECRMALAGGVNLILSPDLYIALSRSRMLAPDGRCKTFDAAADGFARAEGCGVVVLKRLSDARADDDHVLAIIRGSAVNQDGPSSGLTAPNGPAQEAVIREALARAGLSPADVGYIEAHGTGTQLGDPLEMTALGEVFGRARDRAAPLWVGSIKTNFGHLEAAAGVAGLIKCVLSMQHGVIPPHLHFKQPSPHIAWNDLPVQVPTRLMPWEGINGRRIAGVSAFGFSGTNAHIVLEDAGPETIGVTEATVSPVTGARQRVFVLSARSEAALVALAGRCVVRFAPLADASFDGLCRGAATGRAHHSWRAALLARSMDELRTQLQALSRGEEHAGVRVAHVTRKDPARVAMLFTGQGSQYIGMARELYATQPVFREHLDHCAAVLDPLLDQPLRDLLFADSGDPSRLDATARTQPALFAVEYALARLWMAWGVNPVAVMGHSVGEYVAACLAGVLTVDDALGLIATRGRLMQSLPPGGAMAAVFADTARVADALSSYGGQVSIAALNGPAQVVISGKADVVDAVCARLQSEGVRCRNLPVSHAFHSSLVDPILGDFEQAASVVQFSPPRLRVISNLTGRVAEAREITQPGYWRRHVREAVRFHEGLQSLASLGVDVCLEVGPHPTLLAFAQAVFEDAADAPTLVSTLRKDQVDGDQLTATLAALYLAGADIDWSAIWSASPARAGTLPAYPFQREKFWFQCTQRPATEVIQRGRRTHHSLLGARVRSALRDVVQFESLLRPEEVPFLRDHNVQGRLILPATAFLELAMEAGYEVLGATPSLCDVTIVESLQVPEGIGRIVQVLLRDAGEGVWNFEVASCDPQAAVEVWQRHVEGRLEASAGEVPATVILADIRARCTDLRTAQQHYQDLAARGLVFGPALRGVHGILRRDGEALGEIHLPTDEAGHGHYLVHPALLDACIQVVGAALAGDAAREGRAYLPLAIDRVIRHRAPGEQVHSHVRLRDTQGSSVLVADVTLVDDNGPVAEVCGITLRMAAAPTREVYEIAWQACPQADARWLPDPAALAGQVGPQLAALLDAHDVARYQRDYESLERESLCWISEALRALGWQPEAGQRFTTGSLADTLGVVAAFRGALGRFLQILAEEGILRRSGTEWLVPQALAVATVARAGTGGEPTARRVLATACGTRLADVLSGQVDPLHLLFPGGSADLAQSLYRDSPEAMALNQFIRETVRVMVAAMPPGRRIRILEVGGGTGSTTAWVAPMLPAERSEYLFTDIGQFMVTRARERFVTHSFMDFRTLDLEQDLESQGVESGRFDLILASNVIHATADLAATLSRLRGALAPGGTLLMLEVAGFERWIDVTFGLTEGWWRFNDHILRPEYPLLDRAQWITVLQQCGFAVEAVSPQDPRTREVLLAARRNEQADKRARGWLVLTDAAGVGEALAQNLRARGEAVQLVERDDRAPARIAAAIAAEAPGLCGIVHLWTLDTPALAGAPVDAQRAGPGSLLELVRQIGATSFAEGATPQLWVASCGAQPAGGAGLQHPEQAGIWGMGRVIALEHPELHVVRVDLDPAATVPLRAQMLADALQGTSGEDQLALRNGGWLVPRLVPAIGVGCEPLEPRRLEKSAAGVLEDLRLAPAVPVAPGPGEVQIRVAAAGLNFRDVMNAVAMREDPEPLGGECAGRISAVGEGVHDFAVGDHVVAVAEASFATFAVTSARHVARIPEGIGFAEAATLPFAFMTAHHALSVLGGLRAGESVLVHAGAGGVGVAAIQLAHRLGAIVHATAGSEHKRAFLRGIGVARVYDSRSLDFEAQLLRETSGQGVDMVLNSLAGNFIAASVRCLKPAGRFLEIGKRDILTPEQFHRLRPQGTYHAIDLNAQRIQDPRASQQLFAEMIGLASSGAITPLPCTVFPMERADDGFRYMAQARHIGKVVLAWSDAHPASMSQLRADAAYLVTGGLGGLGLLTAQRLVAHGARHLTLMGRRPPSPDALETIGKLRAQGATVDAVQGDVSRQQDVQRVIESMKAAAVPLRGVIHSAGTLSDGALMQQEWQRFALPFGPKIAGAWWLHEATSQARLDFFVVYSSVAGVLGSAGQGNHAAANAFLDAFVVHRREQGLPALSVAWGAWSEVGAAAQRRVDERVVSQGIEVITPARGLELLELLMESGGAHYAVFPVQWEQFLARATAPRSPFLDRVRPAAHAVARSAVADRAPAAPASSMLADLLEATPARREQLLLEFVREHVARVVAAPSAQTIDPREPLNEMGLDSLMAVDLRNRLGKGLGLSRSLPATLVFDHPTVDALARYLLKEILPATPAAAVADKGGTAKGPDAIDDMSDEEVERLFAEKTKRR